MFVLFTGGYIMYGPHIFNHTVNMCLENKKKYLPSYFSLTNIEIM
jgi:hypothetical protein